MMTENTATITSTTVSSLEATKPFRFRSQPAAQDPTVSQFGGVPTSPSPENRPTHSPGRTPSPSRAGSGGDVLLQWGHKKRSRVSRTEIRVLADESSSSAQARQAKVQRRAAHAAAIADKSMPPPPPPPPIPSSSSTSSFSNGRLRKEASGLLPNRYLPTCYLFFLFHSLIGWRILAYLIWFLLLKDLLADLVSFLVWKKVNSLCPPVTLVLGRFKFVSSSYEGSVCQFWVCRLWFCFGVGI